MCSCKKQTVVLLVFLGFTVTSISPTAFPAFYSNWKSICWNLCPDAVMHIWFKTQSSNDDWKLPPFMVSKTSLSVRLDTGWRRDCVGITLIFLCNSCCCQEMWQMLLCCKVLFDMWLKISLVFYRQEKCCFVSLHNTSMK